MDTEAIEAFRQKQLQDAKAKKEQAKHDQLTSTLNNILMATMVSKDPKMAEISKGLSTLLEQIKSASSDFSKSSLHLLPVSNHQLAKTIQGLADKVEKYSSQDLAPLFKELNSKIDAVAKRQPIVNVPTQPVKVDLTPLLTAIKGLNTEVPETDTKSIVKAVKESTKATENVNKSLNTLQFPTPNYVLPFKSVDGKATQVILDADGKVPTSGAGGGGVQYESGDEDPDPIGNAIMWKNPTDNVVVVSEDDPLPTDVKTLPVAFDSGATSATTQRVIAATNSPEVTALQIIDDWDESDRAKVNPIVGQAGVQAGAGAVSATTQRVVLATDTTVPVTSVTPGTTASSLGKAEDAQHASGDVGVMDLAVRNDTMADFTGADNDYIPKSATAKGQMLTVNAPRGRKLHQITTITASTSETTILTAAASTFHDVYGIIATNTSATPTEIHVRDDTAGTIRFTLSCPANDTRGFMLPVDAAMVASATNDNWTATCADSVSSIIITVFAVKNL